MLTERVLDENSELRRESETHFLTRLRRYGMMGNAFPVASWAGISWELHAMRLRRKVAGSL